MSKPEVRTVVSLHPTRERMQQYGRRQDDGLWRYTPQEMEQIVADVIEGREAEVLYGVAALDNLGKVYVWWDDAGNTLIQFLEDDDAK